MAPELTPLMSRDILMILVLAFAALAGLMGVLAFVWALRTRRAGSRRAMALEAALSDHAAGRARLEAHVEQLERRLEERAQTLFARDSEITRQHTTIEELRAEIAGARMALVKDREAHEEKVAALTTVREHIEKDMKLLADALLKENTESFLTRAREVFEAQSAESRKGVETLVKPIDDRLKAYADQLQQMEQSRKRDEGALGQQMQQIAETAEKLRSTTGNLVTALRSAPKTRGRWGEQQLRTVLEMAGMMEYVDFQTEHHVPTDDGPLRPDVVLRLPGGRVIVVDAKTPMSAYLDAMEAETDADRERLLREHSAQMKAHVKQLSGKAYWDSLPQAPDFVVMFVPGDNLYAAAIERDPDLFEFAYDSQVIIATPTTLLALAKAVAFGWRQERASADAQNVLKEGTELYRRLKGMGDKVMEMSKALSRTVDKHNELVGAVEVRVLPQARRLHDIGVGASAGEMQSPTVVDKTVREPREGKDLEFASRTETSIRRAPAREPAQQDALLFDPDDQEEPAWAKQS